MHEFLSSLWLLQALNYSSEWGGKFWCCRSLFGLKIFYVDGMIIPVLDQLPVVLFFLARVNLALFSYKELKYAKDFESKFWFGSHMSHFSLCMKLRNHLSNLLAEKVHLLIMPFVSCYFMVTALTFFSLENTNLSPVYSDGIRKPSVACPWQCFFSHF